MIKKENPQNLINYSELRVIALKVVEEAVSADRIFQLHMLLQKIAS